MTGNPAAIDALIFDLGGVLIDWDARYLFQSMLPDDAAIAEFLADVGFDEWNRALDGGRDWDEAVAWLSARHPDRAALIEAFRDRWEETLGGPMEPVVEILEELRRAGYRTFALSNWSRRTFDIGSPRFGFLAGFEGIVLSGDVGVTKPDPRIYRVLLDRYGLRPETTVFIDDAAENVEAAAALGMVGIRYGDPAQLRAGLRGLGLPLAARA